MTSSQRSRLALGVVGVLLPATAMLAHLLTPSTMTPADAGPVPTVTLPPSTITPTRVVVSPAAAPASSPASAPAPATVAPTTATHAPSRQPLPLPAAPGGDIDQTAPTAPSGMSLVGNDGVVFTLAWTASADDSGDVSYLVAVDGAVVTTVTEPRAEIAWPGGGQQVLVQVTAVDATGNCSEWASVWIAPPAEPTGPVTHEPPRTTPSTTASASPTPTPTPTPACPPSPPADTEATETSVLPAASGSEDALDVVETPNPCSTAAPEAAEATGTPAPLAP